MTMSSTMCRIQKSFLDILQKPSLLTPASKHSANSRNLLFCGLLVLCQGAIDEAGAKTKSPEFLLQCTFEPRPVKRGILKPIDVLQLSKPKHDVQMVLKMWQNSNPEEHRPYGYAYTKTECVCRYDPERELMLLTGRSIDVEPRFQGKGYSSIMRAVQILFTESVIASKVSPFNKLHPKCEAAPLEFVIPAVGSHPIHYSQGFTSFGNDGSDAWSQNCRQRWDKFEFDDHVGRNALTAVFQEMKEDRKRGVIQAKTKPFETFLKQKTLENRARNVPDRDASIDSDSAGNQTQTLGSHHIDMVMETAADLWKKKGWSIDIQMGQPSTITVSRHHEIKAIVNIIDPSAPDGSMKRPAPKDAKPTKRQSRDPDDETVDPLSCLEVC